jgi:formylmethanofuran dehydrogenase subunit A
MTRTDDTSPPSLALAIVNARVSTADPRRPWADAVLVRDGRIEAVGSSAEIRKRAGDGIRVIDARGLTVIPGSVDGVLASGQPATLVVTAQSRPADPARDAEDGNIVLRLDRGRIVVDRDAPAQPNR